jgi:ABC-2 type transport system permease protein
MNFLSLIANETELMYIEMRQYWFETVTSLVIMSVMFTGLFYGVKSFIGDNQDTTSLDGLVFGFLLWTFASSAYLSVGKSVVEDNQKGFIEQLFLCPVGFSQLMLVRTLVEMTWGMVFLTVIAIIAMFLTGNWIAINFFYFYLLLMVSAPSLIGVGFIISGLALVYKRIDAVAMLINIGLMGLVALDALPVNLFSLLPFTAGASLARDVVLEGGALNIMHLGVVVANSVVYLLIGLFAFNKLEKRAKKLNLIGQY